MQVELATIEAFNDVNFEPRVQGVRLDWTFQERGWNTAVIMALASELEQRIRADASAMTWPLVQKIAGEGDKKQARVWLQKTIKTKLVSQKKKVQERLRISSVTHESPNMSLEEAAEHRRKSRQKGVRISFTLRMTHQLTILTDIY